MDRSQNLPKDLRIVRYKPMNWIVYESKSQQRFFVSYYYESGHFQGNLVLELNADEISKYKHHPQDLLNDQSKLISSNFIAYDRERNIEEFSKLVDSSRLIQKWKNEKPDR